MEEDGEDSTPFWGQSTTNRGRVGRRVSSFLLSSGLLVSILLVTAVSFLVFVVPSTISFSSQIFRPNQIKKSWDSLNLVLVLLALVFGFLSRNKNEDRNFDEHQTTSPRSTRTENQESNPSSTQQGWNHYSSFEPEKSNPSNPPQWYGYSDHQTASNSSAFNNSKVGGLMRRNSSSYPDLLAASSGLTSGDDPWKSYDDMTIETPRYYDTGQLHRRRSWKYSFGDSQLESRNLYADKFVNHHPKEQPSNPPAATPPPAPPQVAPPVPPDNEKQKRTHQSFAHERERRRKRKDNQLVYTEPISEPATPPPPPPPPPPLPQFVDQRSGKSEKKRTRGSAARDFLNSLYHKKKKKQRQKSVENFDTLLHQSQMPPLHFQLPPPSPPSSPASVLQNLFSSKKTKRKRKHTVISVPIPPPPPSPPAAAIFSRPKTTQKPPQPVKVRSFGSEEGNSNSGGESPLIPIPPPPPPFFKAPAWKFVLQGDYVRINSNVSSRSGSPDLDDVESDGTTTAADGVDADASPFPPSPLFCSSPDVDTKAESFISKFRAGLKLEKIDSINRRQGMGFSNLGPGSGPNHI